RASAEGSAACEHLKPELADELHQIRLGTLFDVPPPSRGCSAHAATPPPRAGEDTGGQNSWFPPPFTGEVPSTNVNSCEAEGGFRGGISGFGRVSRARRRCRARSNSAPARRGDPTAG